MRILHENEKIGVCAVGSGSFLLEDRGGDWGDGSETQAYPEAGTFTVARGSRRRRVPRVGGPKPKRSLKDCFTVPRTSGGEAVLQTAQIRGNLPWVGAVAPTHGYGDGTRFGVRDNMRNPQSKAGMFTVAQGMTPPSGCGRVRSRPRQRPFGGIPQANKNPPRTSGTGFL